ncbi:hypothetical protein ACIRP3_41360 [Streptomyces sp. NPDC101209]|uniref:hypothetical protein n=1 Tax=Streptomyces sp. NPDC101209 TaxID=3366129 RepID=UPI003802ECE7
MAQLKPISLDRFAEAREEAYIVLARLMARLAPGEHVVRLGVTMDGQERPLTATLPLTVEGAGTLDDLVGAEEKYLDNMAFLLACGLAQPLSYGVMYLRSPSGQESGPASTIRAWHLAYTALNECSAAEAAELVGDGEQGTGFADAFGVHDEDETEGEAVYPPVAYTVL